MGKKTYLYSDGIGDIMKPLIECVGVVIKAMLVIFALFIVVCSIGGAFVWLVGKL